MVLLPSSLLYYTGNLQCWKCLMWSHSSIFTGVSYRGVQQWLHTNKAYLLLIVHIGVDKEKPFNYNPVSTDVPTHGEVLVWLYFSITTQLDNTTMSCCLHLYELLWLAPLSIQHSDWLCNRIITIFLSSMSNYNSNLPVVFVIM